MAKYEYQILPVDFHGPDQESWKQDQSILNSQDSEGWELVTVFGPATTEGGKDQIVYYFRREK